MGSENPEAGWWAVLVLLVWELEDGSLISAEFSSAFNNGSTSTELDAFTVGTESL
jgi:hypothetical protein